MNIHRSWVRLALLFLLAAVVGFAIPSTLAYITAQSDTLVNTFEAPYFPPEGTGVEVRIQKTVLNSGTESIGPGGFRFGLQHAQSSEPVILTSDVDGYASIILPFTDVDLGQTHVYHLYEINDGRANVTYSNKVYTIEITLSVDAENRIVADASVDGVPVEQIIAAFENTYYEGIILPPTGDECNVALYVVLMLLSGAGLVILLTRRNRVIG